MSKPGSYAYLPLERVIFGRPAAEAAVEEAARTGATRVFIVASKTLATKTPVVRTIAEALGRHYVGLFDGCVQHSPRASIIAATRAVRAAAPDLILTVGGGTAIDTVKVLQICLAHEVDSTEALDGLHVSIGPDGKRQVPDIRPSPVRQVAVPTTLSGAEFSNLAAWWRAYAETLERMAPHLANLAPMPDGLYEARDRARSELAELAALAATRLPLEWRF